jgi:D-sedoheptulose 7-phosphate isomerase
MTLDPRFNNVLFDNSSIGAYLKSYAQSLGAALAGVDTDALDRARVAIESASTNGGRLFAIGNGGSAAIADHLSCDLTKGTCSHNHPVVDTMSMTSNVALYSAIANDIGFEAVFSTQLKFIGRAGDVLIAVSSSGNSQNIIEGVLEARRRGMTVIGVSGFTGGLLLDQSKANMDKQGRPLPGEFIPVHVAVSNYGIVEDAHQALMHVMAQYIVSLRDRVGPLT